jgi:site-specific recombinase XerC
MEQERGMEERPSTPALYEFPPLSRLHFFSPQNQGGIADYLQSPIRLPRHYSMVPQDLPRPRAEEEVSAFFQGINALRDRAMFLLMLRCGLRVGEVSRLPWSAIDLTQGTVLHRSQ